jgi:N12 class adenine-specific DNA methylase
MALWDDLQREIGVKAGKTAAETLAELRAGTTAPAAPRDTRTPTQRGMVRTGGLHSSLTDTFSEWRERSKKHLENPAEYELRDVAAVPGAADIIAEQEAWQPGAEIPERFAQIQRADEPGKVWVHPGVKGLQMQQAFEAGRQAPAAEQGPIDGMVNAFTRGSNDLAANLLGGGTDLLATGIEAATGRDQSGAHDVARGYRDTFESEMYRFPKSGSAEGLNPQSWRWWTENLAEQTPAFAAMLAPGMGTAGYLARTGATVRATEWITRAAGAGAAFGIEATSAYEDFYQQFKKLGADDDTAHSMAAIEGTTVGVINAILEQLPLGEFVLGKNSGLPIMQRAVRGFFVEGGTEALQELPQMILMKLNEGGNPLALTAQDIEQVVSAALLGGAMGAGAGAATGGSAAAPPAGAPQSGPGAVPAPTSPTSPIVQQAASQAGPGFDGAPPVGDGDVQALLDAAGPPPTPPSSQTGAGSVPLPVPEGTFVDPDASAAPTAEEVKDLNDRADRPDTLPAAENREEAIQTAKARAGVLETPVYVIKTAEGFKLDQRRPTSGAAVVVHPDGTIKPLLNAGAGATPPATERRAPSSPPPVTGARAGSDTPTVPGATTTAALKTRSPKEMLDYIKSKNTGELDVEATRQLLGGKRYELRTVPLASVGPIFGASGVDEARVARYSEQETDAPPIVLGQMDGKGPLRPIDGKHRLLAARKRKDMAIKAYVPADSPIGIAVEEDADTTTSPSPLPSPSTHKSAAAAALQAVLKKEGIEIDVVVDTPAPKKGPTPQVPAPEGTRYVIPSFVTDPHKPKAEKPAGKLKVKDLRSGKETTIPTWKPIGRNAKGAMIFEDERGVRSIIDSGFRVTEPVGIVPDGTITVDHKGDYVVAPAKESADTPPSKGGTTDGNTQDGRPIDGQREATDGKTGRREAQDDDQEQEERVKPVTPKKPTAPATQAPSAPSKKLGADNKLVTSARMDELKAKLRAKLDGSRPMSVGPDPEIMALAAELALGYAEAGVRKFADYARQAVRDVGDSIKPYLKGAYLNAMAMDGADEFREEMTPAAEVMSVKKDALDAILAAEDESDGRSTADQTADEARTDPAGSDLADVRAGQADEGTGTAERKPVLRDVPQVDGGAGSASAARAADRGERGDPASQHDAGPDGGSRAGARADSRGAGRAGSREGDGDGDRRADGSAGPGDSSPASAAADREGESVPRAAEGAPSDLSVVNHRIGPDDVLIPGGDVTKTRANIRALRILKELEQSGRAATLEERQAMAQYVGWGGLAPVLDDYKQERLDSGKEWMVDDATKNWRDKWGKFYAELKALLTEEEWRSAKATTEFAHYTSREVIEQGLWAAVKQLGIKGGRFLEAGAGMGHVLGLTPSDIDAKWTAVEIDNLSGRMMKHLYPAADVQITGFQTSRIADASIDLMIGNVPFSQDGVYDADLPRFSLHNYFFARGINKVKPGGFIVAITSNSTMDNGASREFRHWMNERADLVAAIRLPNDAFKKNAGTDVTTDILIFRKGDGKAFPSAQNWLHTHEQQGTDKNGDAGTYPLNEYFTRNPEMMLGEMGLFGTQYGPGDPALKGRPGQDTLALLAAAVRKIPADLATFDPSSMTQADIVRQAQAGSKEFSYQLDGDDVRQVQQGALTAVEWTGPQTERARAWLPIRESTKRLVAMQLDPASTDGEIDTARAELNDLYDRYVASHGYINARTSRFLSDDPEYPLTAALEFIDNEPVVTTNKKGEQVTRFVETYRKADILRTRTIFPQTRPERAESATDAITLSEAWTGTIDMPYVAKLLGKSEEKAAEDVLATGRVFRDPTSGRLVVDDEYLSGNVREKLAAATKAAEADQAYKPNVEALTAVQPLPVKLLDIDTRIGSPWIPGSVFVEWVGSLLGTGTGGTRIEYIPQTGTFAVEFSPWARNSEQNLQLGGGGLPATEILTELFHMKAPVAYDAVPGEDGKTKLVKNAERTIAAQAAGVALKERFNDWVKRSKHVAALEAAYNEKYNAFVLRNWRGADFKHFPNAAKMFDKNGKELELRPYQKGAVRRGLVESYLLAHFVGAGKTFTFVTTAMEWKRLGLARKPMIVTQNATTQQIVESFKRLYPWANVLAPTAEDFEGANRKRLMSRIATGNYDAVIVAQSHFNRIADDPAREQAFVQERIDLLTDALAERRRAAGKSDPTVKELQRAIRREEAKMEKLLDREKDDSLTFEQLGVDGLIVDEAHAYKKLAFFTQADNIKGLDTTPSQRAMGLFLKSRFIQERNNGKGVILATGTPVSNTMAEAWTMVRYVRPDLLDAFGVPNFDDYLNTFTEADTRWEMNDTGNWKQVTRLSKFTNGFELVKFFHSAADTIDPEQANLPRPGLKGGAPQILVLKRTPAVAQYMTYLMQRYEAWERLPGKEKREQSSEPLVINGLAKKAALDLRLVDPKLPDDPGSKLNRAVEEVYKRWVAGKEGKTTQVIFADNYQSTGAEADVTLGLDEKGKVKKRKIADADRFNLFHEIQKKLIAKGVPAAEVAIIYDHDTDKKRPLLFQRVNAGEVRIVMGHTEKLGVGVNIQERLIAQHQLDAPWRPSDVEQREGRILRQGNTNAEVEILRYGVEQTFDAGAYDRLATKQRFINDLITGKIKARTGEDVGGDVIASFQDAAADISGDPIAKEKFQVDAKIKQLEALANSHEQGVIDARQRLATALARPEELERAAAKLAKWRGDVAPRFEKAEDAVVEFMEDHKILKGDEAWERLDAYVKSEMTKLEAWALENTASAFSNRFSRKIFGVSINGVDVSLTATVAQGTSGTPTGSPWIALAMKLGDEASAYGHWGDITSGRGAFTSVKRAVTEVAETREKEATASADRYRKDAKSLAEFVENPFPREQELRDAQRRRGEILAELARRAEEKKREGDNRAAAASPAPEADLEEESEGEEELGSVGTMRELEPGQDALGAKPPVNPNPRIAPAPLPGGQKKKLGEIILDFTKLLARSPVRHAPTKRAGFIGTYFPGTTRAIIRYYGDLDTTAHEVAHFIDDHFSIAGAWASNRVKSPFDKELIPHFSGHGSVTKSGPRARLRYKRAEGIAEWMRAYIVNPTAAKAAAPKFYAHYLKTVPAEYRAAVDAFSEDVRKFAGTAPEERTLLNVRDAIKADTRPFTQRVREWFTGKGLPFETTGFQRLAAATVDDLGPIRVAIDALKKIRTDLKAPLPADDPQGLLQDWTGVEDKLAAILEDGMIVLKPSPGKRFEHAPGVGGGWKWLLGDGLADTSSLEKFNADHELAVSYLLNTATVERAENFIRDTELQVKGLIDAHMEAHFPFGSGRVPPPGYDPLTADPALAARVAKMRAATQARISRISGMGGGIFNDYQQAKDAVRNLTADPARAKKVKELAGRYRAWSGAVLRYMRDSGRLSEMRYNAYVARNQEYAAMHRVMEGIDPSLKSSHPGRRLGSSAEPVKGFKGSTRMLDNPYVNLIAQTFAIVKESDRNRILDRFTDYLVSDRPQYGGPPGKTNKPAFSPALDWIGSETTSRDKADKLKVYKEGRARYFNFEAGIYAAARGWGQVESMDVVLEAVGKITARLPRYLITHAPAFVVRSAIREPINRAIISASGSKPQDILTQSTKEEQLARRLAGGAQQQFASGGRESIHKEMRRMMTQIAGDKGSVLLLPGRAAAAYEAFVQKWGEQANRDAEYRAAYKKFIAQGMDEHNASIAAAREAKALLDYLVAGSVIRKLMKVIPFLNVGIQGPRITVKAFLRDKKGFVKRWGVYVMAPRLIFMLLRAALDQDDEYQQLPAWRRDFFLNVKIGGIWLTMPNPFEAGILGAGAERILRTPDLGFEKSWGGFGSNVLKALIPVDEFIIGGPVRAVVETMTNHSFFFDRYIVPPYEADANLELRKGAARASRVGQVLQEVIGVDARHIDNFIINTGGGLGRLALDTSDLGRADRSLVRFLMSGGGIFTGTPAYGSVDVQFVMDKARDLNDGNSLRIRGLNNLLNEYNAAEGLAAQNAAAKRLRERAAVLRKFYEQQGGAILDAKKKAG